MKPQMTTVTAESNLNEDNDFNATVNLDKVHIFIEMLIRNYNDPVTAVLREWVSNAYDSHLASGQTAPVEVTLPTAFERTLVVKDTGLGMSYDDFRSIYMNFLTSTKDTENSSVGGFGIGGKSALALADQYVVTTVKDGLLNVFIIERSNAGIRPKNPVHNRPTDQPNGVECKVVLSSKRELRQTEIDSILGGWGQQEVKLTHGEFKSIEDGAQRFDAGYLMKANGSHRGYGSMRLLLGPVLYELDHNFFRTVERKEASRWSQLSGSGLVPIMPIGSLTIPSSREVIEATVENVKRVGAKLDELYEEIRTQVQTQVDSMTDLKEIYKLARSVRSINAGDQEIATITYEGEAVPTSVEAKDNQLFVFDGQYQGTWKLYASHGQRGRDMEEVVIAVERDNDYSLDHFRKLLRGYIQQTGLDFQKVRGHNASVLAKPTLNRWERALAHVVVKESELVQYTTPQKGRTSSKTVTAVPANLLGNDFRSQVSSGYRSRYGKSPSLGDALEGKSYKKVVVVEGAGLEADSHYLGRLLHIVTGFSQDVAFFAPKAHRVAGVKASLALPESVAAYGKLEVVSFKEWFDGLTSKELRATVKRVHHMGRLRGLGLSDVYQDPTKVGPNFAALVKNATPELLSHMEANDFIRAARGHLAEKLVTKLQANGLDFKKFTVAGSKSGPFSLLRNMYRGSDMNKELSAYLEWSATRLRESEVASKYFKNA